MDLIVDFTYLKQILHKNRKIKRKLLPKHEEIAGWKVHINKRKLNWNVSTTDVFLNQKRVRLLFRECVVKIFNIIYLIL